MKYKGYTFRYVGLQEMLIYKGRHVVHAFTANKTNSGCKDEERAKAWIAAQTRDQSLPVEPPTRGRNKLMKG